ncbi:helix-turn-helix domain-containing protein [Providencia sp. PROV257]|uniref:helix-turn-helix domain-containing protein n=1 Tax=Providencia sp. PROV257 TaxID=2949945 RepID=UPI00234A8396|nr:helix-turn-helix transcriptional regulator [Providencia sp. PROV257]
MNELSKRVGQRIKLLRNKNNMTAKELGFMLNLSQQHISRYESGKSSIHVDILYEIKKIFNVDIEYFFEN